MIKVNVKSCPFCGAPAKWETYNSGGKELYLLKCGGQHCPMSPAISSLNPDNCRAYWNHRACDGDKGYWEYDPSTYKGNICKIGQEGTWQLVAVQKGKNE